MARVAHLFDQKQVGWKLVEGKRRFVISDDLVIKPASTANTHLLLQTISSGGIDRSFEEIEVCVGWAEHQVFYDSHEKKVMYAECDHEFVDLLLSFLVYPVACVIKNFAGTSHLGCSLDNLYGSAVDLDSNGLLAERGYYRKTLLDPSISPFNLHSKQSTQKWFCLCRVQYCHSPQFVNNGTYVVDDDLLIYQASAMLVMKHWCNRGKDRVLEMDIAISKQEAVDLLRATLTSKTARTDVFKSKLEDKCKLSLRLQQNNFQIFVKLHTGKTITRDVENHDTIATVKHKINEKVGLQLPAGYPYHLVYGNRLPDSSTIADCNIGKGSTIHFAVYMGGGN
ncbi:uncharacterized protein [Miscanthus floridulus]|uniref:uncharacterized protein n=1 Tax=Miscanthus floridulus TaxID=154761 RepID=UPI003459E577